MATQVIGLDIGTNAVRAVELSIGRDRSVLRRMGQVGLPPGAVVAGEVVDPGVVSTALRRLWREAGFKSRSVVVGVANSRVVARVATLPKLSESELRSSLPYQVQDLIPMKVEDAQLDFQMLESVDDVDNPDRVQVLLVAAHREMLRMLLAALDGARLRATAIDLVPFALVRALYDPASESSGGGPEVIIGVGAGVTNVVVHEHGVLRFVRTLPTGGAAVTDAIARELDLDGTAAEGAKRGLLDVANPSVDEIARASVVPLANDVSGTLDYHLAQSDRSEIHRVVLFGGGTRLAAMQAALADHLGAEVVVGNALTRLQVGRVGLTPEALSSSADLFTVAIGLALSGRTVAGETRRASLLPTEETARRTGRRRTVLVGASAAAAAAALVSLAYLRDGTVQHAREEAARVDARVASLQTQVAKLKDVTELQGKIGSQRQLVTATLAGDVAWPALIREINAARPPDVWLSSLSVAAGTGQSGATLQLAASGPDHDSVAHWLQQMETLPEISNVWVPSSAKAAATMGVPSTVKFQSTANLTPAAGSDRARKIAEDTK